MNCQYSQGLAEFPKLKNIFQQSPQLLNGFRVLFQSLKGGSNIQGVTVTHRTPTRSITVRTGMFISLLGLPRPLIGS